MLVTLRREGECLWIGEEIEIEILHVGRTRVRLGIRAPRAYPVVPAEGTCPPKTLAVPAEENSVR